MLSALTKSIGRKLSASFVSMLILATLVGAAGVVGVIAIRNELEKTLEVDFQAEELAALSLEEFLDAHVLELAYLPNYSVEGLEQAHTDFVAPFEDLIAELKTTLVDMETLENNFGQRDDAETIKELETIVETYQEDFLAVVNLLEERGLVDDGLMGEMRTAANEIETQVMTLDDFEAESLLLQARRNEKDYLLRTDPIYVTRFDEAITSLKSYINSSERSLSQRNNLDTLADNYQTNFHDIVDIDAEIQSQLADYQESIELIQPALDTIMVEARSGSAAAENTILDDVNMVVEAIGIVLVIAVIIGVALSYVITRGISMPLVNLMSVTQKVGEGDLDQSVNVTSSDEIGMLGRAFNTMVAGLREGMATVVAKEYLEEIITRYQEFVGRVSEGDLTQRLELAKDGAGQADVNDDLYQLGVNLNTMVANLRSMASQVREMVASMTSATTEIQAATTQQTASATEQNATVTQTVATVEEVRQTVQQTAERARMVAENANRSMEVSLDGQRAVESTVEGMNIIRERVESIAENILMLSERTQQIGEIIDTVNGLADQSKLLALNASIEAARAGEEGKGFAVVAMEVRQLAEQSRDATSRVQGILSEIQQATNTAVMVTEEGSKGAEQGMSLVEQAGIAIRDLASTIEEAAQAAGQIAASTQQQTNGMDQLSVAMTQIEQATAQAAATTQQTETSVRDLLDMAQQLELAAARYQL